MSVDNELKLLAAQAQADQLREAIMRVRHLHRAIEVEPSDTICAECSTRLPNGRYMPIVEYPCPTIQAIQGDEQ